MKTLDLANIVTELEARIGDECRSFDTEERYNDMLDDCYSLETVGGPFAHMSASRVLKEVDPVAYRCGLNDYADGEAWVEVAGDTYEQDDAEEVKEELEGELETRESELEEELEEWQAERSRDDGLPDADEEDRIQKELAAIRDALAALRKHSF